MMMNISDPGDNWWLRDEGDHFTIHFQLSHTKNDGSMTKLGPLGDGDQIMQIFLKLRGYFSILFPLATLSSGHGQMVMGTSDSESKIFQGIKELFLKGETCHTFWEHLRELEMNAANKIEEDGGKFLRSLQKANFFLMELATIRRFWMAIQAKL